MSYVSETGGTFIVDFWRGLYTARLGFAYLEPIRFAFFEHLTLAKRLGACLGEMNRRTRRGGAEVRACVCIYKPDMPNLERNMGAEGNIAK
jgi:hypothetical protein